MKRFFSLYSLIALLLAAGTADLRAQNVVVDKSQLTLSAQFGGAVASGPLNVTSSTGAAMTYYAFANNPWIKVNGQTSISGTTPATITVQADPTGLAPATYTGSVSIFGASNSVTVSISLTVSNIGVSPTSLSFSGYTVGSGTIPNPQTLTLTGTATSFTAAASTSSGGSWLQVAPATGTSPGTVQVSLNSAILPGLAVGNYSGKVTITPVGTASGALDVPVTLAVSALPVVTVAPKPISFAIQLGGTNNITQRTMTISTAPAAATGYYFSSTVDPNPAGKNWILVNPPSGNTDAQTGSAQVTVGVDSSNLPAGSYNGQLQLSTPGGSPATTNIPVSLAISSSPLLNIPATALNFTCNIGNAAPAAQTVNVTATSGTLGYTVAVGANAPWLTADANGTTAAPFSVSVNPTGLAAGTYTGTLTVTGTASGSGSQQITVNLKVTDLPTIVTNLPSGTSFPYQIGQSSVPAAQTLSVTSSTGAGLTFSASAVETSCTSSNWLLVNGTTAAVTGATPGNLTLSVNPTGLAAGTCQGKIAISATVTATGAAAVNSPVEVPVTFYVSATPLVVLSPPAPLKFTAAVGAQSVPPQSITLTSTSAAPADLLNYSVSFQTANGGNWLFAGPLSGTTASPGNVVTVSVIPSLLSAGTYTGSVTITATGASAVANSPVTVPVTLTVTAGTLTLSANSLQFTSAIGGTAPASQTVTIGSSGTALSYTAVAATNVTPSWLSVSPASGNTSANATLTVTADPSNLGAGTYTGTITITAPNAGNSPQAINVSLTVQPGTISAPATTLTFNQLAGGTAPAAQTIAVTSSPGPLNFTVAPGPNSSWLTVSPTSGSTPATISVTVEGGSRVPGQYAGSVVITSAGAAGSPITVPVVFNILTSQMLVAHPTALNFAYTIGQGAPASQTLAITSSGGGTASISAQVSSAAAAWLNVSPSTAVAPANLTVSVTPGSLAAATYTGTITVSSPSALNALTIPVTLTVSQVPTPLINSITNAASYASGAVSPGENITIFGTGIGPATLTAGTVTNGAWTTIAGNTRVLFDGVAAPVIYASATQTSVMVPYGVAGRAITSVAVEYSGVQSSPVSYNVTAAAPGIYTLNQQGTGPGAVLNQDGVTVNSPSAPEKIGNVVAVYMTGEGQTTPGGVDGSIIPAVASSLKKPLLPVTATIGGVAANVLYYGSAPGLVSGVMQVNLQIPSTVATGSAVPIQITVGTAATQSGVTVAITQ